MSEIRFEVPGVVLHVEVEVGTEVAAGDEVAMVESMKMELPVVAAASGTVAEIRVAPGQPVETGDVAMVLA